MGLPPPCPLPAPSLPPPCPLPWAGDCGQRVCGSMRLRCTLCMACMLWSSAGRRFAARGSAAGSSGWRVQSFLTVLPGPGCAVTVLHIVSCTTGLPGRSPLGCCVGTTPLDHSRRPRRPGRRPGHLTTTPRSSHAHTHTHTRPSRSLYDVLAEGPSWSLCQHPN